MHCRNYRTVGTGSSQFGYQKGSTKLVWNVTCCILSLMLTGWTAAWWQRLTEHCRGVIRRWLYRTVSRKAILELFQDNAQSQNKCRRKITEDNWLIQVTWKNGC